MRTVLLGALMSFSEAWAEFIPAECIFRSARFGTDRGEAFSSMAQLTEEVGRDMSFYGYTECNDRAGSLSTFEVVLADAS